MKATFVSTAAVSQALRYSLMRTQSELIKAQKEVVDRARRRCRPGARRAHRPVGVLRARPRAAEGHRRFQRAGLRAADVDAGCARPDLQRGPEFPVDADHQRFRRRLAVGHADRRQGHAASADRDPQLQLQWRAYLFAGINTDVKPINDFTATGSPNKAAFDAGFLSFFGFTQERPGRRQHHRRPDGQLHDHRRRAAIPRRRLARQLVERHRRRHHLSRIALNETAQTSVSANDDGMRKLAMAAAMVTDMFDSAMSATSPRKTAAHPRRRPGRRSR